jgi:CheY-like chemotaxis protein
MSKILIIEDDPTQSMMYGLEFSNKGFEVSIASSGKEGIAKAQTEKPDLIFCDMLLGDLSGQDIVKTLKADDLTKGITIVALSNLNKKEVQDEMIGLGARDFLVKVQYVPKDIAAKASEYLAK